MSATVVSVHQLPPTAASGLSSADARETFIYVVVLSEPDGVNGARTARDAAGIPAVNDPLGSTGLVVLRKRADKEGDDSGINYRVTVEYGVNTTSDSGSGSEPWTGKDRIRRLVKAYQFNQGADLAGTAIANGAGDPLLGGLVFDRYNPVLVVNRYRRFSDFDPEAAIATIGTLNSAGITLNPKKGIVTFDAGKARLIDFTCNDAVWPATGTFYFDITFSLEIEKDVPLENYYAPNKGYFYLELGNAVPNIVTKAGKSALMETYLDDNGYRVAAADYTGVTKDGSGAWVRGNDLQFKRALRASWGWLT